MSTLSRRARRAAFPTLLATAVLALAACATDGAADATGPSSTAAPTTADEPGTPTATAASEPTAATDTGAAISIGGFAYTPATLTVPAGTTVTWTNDEDALHTVTSGTPDARTDGFDSGEIDTGVEFPVTFDEAGTFPFFCDRHEFMRGEITVTP